MQFDHRINFHQQLRWILEAEASSTDRDALEAKPEIPRENTNQYR